MPGLLFLYILWRIPKMDDDNIIEIPYKNKVVKKYTEDEILGYERRLVSGELFSDEEDSKKK